MSKCRYVWKGGREGAREGGKEAISVVLTTRLVPG